MPAQRRSGRSSACARPTLYTAGTVTGFNLNLPVAPGLLWSDLDLEPRHLTVREGIPAVLDGWLHFRWRHPLADRAGRP